VKTVNVPCLFRVAIRSDDWRSLFFKKALLCRVRRAMDGANHSDFRMFSPEFMASKQKLPQMDLHFGDLT
jgi:hypothetical protein